MIKFVAIALALMCSFSNAETRYKFNCHQLAVVDVSSETIGEQGEILYCRNGTKVWQFYPEHSGWSEIPMIKQSDDAHNDMSFRCHDMISEGSHLYCLSGSEVWKYYSATERWQSIIMRKLDL